MVTTMEEDKIIFHVLNDLTSHKVSQILDLARQEVNKLDVDRYTDIYLDMSQVDDIDSLGITFVVGLYKTAMAKEKGFKVTGLSQQILRLFKTMRLDEVFSVSPVKKEELINAE